MGTARRGTRRRPVRSLVRRRPDSTPPRLTRNSLPKSTCRRRAGRSSCGRPRRPRSRRAARHVCHDAELAPTVLVAGVARRRVSSIVNGLRTSADWLFSYWERTRASCLPFSRQRDRLDLVGQLIAEVQMVPVASRAPFEPVRASAAHLADVRAAHRVRNQNFAVALKSDADQVRHSGAQLVEHVQQVVGTFQDSRVRSLRHLTPPRGAGRNLG